MEYLEYVNHPYVIPAVLFLGWLIVVLMWRRGKWKNITALAFTTLVGTGIWHFGTQRYLAATGQEPPIWVWAVLVALTLLAVLYKPGEPGKSGRGSGGRKNKAREKGRSFWGRRSEPDLPPQYSDDVGYVYVITNPAHKEGIVKIGMTEQSDYMTRIRQLHDTSTPYPFDVKLVIRTTDARGLESKLHDIFDKRRLNSNREFFEVSPEEVLRRLPNIGNPYVVEDNT